MNTPVWSLFVALVVLVSIPSYRLLNDQKNLVPDLSLGVKQNKRIDRSADRFGGGIGTTVTNCSKRDV
jgi:hypothetical protein